LSRHMSKQSWRQCTWLTILCIEQNSERLSPISPTRSVFIASSRRRPTVISSDSTSTRPSTTALAPDRSWRTSKRNGSPSSFYAHCETVMLATYTMAISKRRTLWSHHGTGCT
jgi:hypothetical protein